MEKNIDYYIKQMQNYKKLSKFNDSLEENVDQTELEKMKINLENIATAAMIHDIGKLCKDKELLQRALSVKKYLVKSFPAINDLDLENYNDNYSSIYSCLLLFGNTSLSPDILVQSFRVLNLLNVANAYLK